MTGEQIRAARTLLGWTAAQLGKAAGVSYPTIQRLDATQGAVSGRHATIEAVRNTLEREGVQFVSAGDIADGPGVVLRQSHKTKGDTT